jgi:hypothetical protein
MLSGGKKLKRKTLLPDGNPARATRSVTKFGVDWKRPKNPRQHKKGFNPGLTTKISG